MKDRRRHKRVAAYRSTCCQQVRQAPIDSPAAKDYWLRCLLRGTTTYVEIHEEIGSIEPNHPLGHGRIWWLKEPLPDPSRMILWVRQLEADVGIRRLSREAWWREMRGVVPTEES